MTKVAGSALQADEERTIAHRILALEADLRGMLEADPGCSTILRSGRRGGRTRAMAVDRLEVAIQALEADEAPGELRAAAREKWTEAQALRWRLAMSATHVAYREAHRLGSNAAVTWPDLVQEGVLGLLAAAKRYEPDHDIRFATYARWWVRAHMTRAIDLARLVHLSAAACEQLRNLRKQIRFHDVAGEAWTTEGVASELGIDAEQARTLLAMGGTQSLDDAGEDGEEPVATLQIADDTLPMPDESVARSEDEQRVREAVESTLPERLRYVVLSRYGIGQEPKPLITIARELKLSRERVRQLEQASIELLRDAYGRDGVPGMGGRSRPPRPRGRRR